MKIKTAKQYIKGAEKDIQNAENNLNDALSSVEKTDHEHKQQIEDTLKAVDEALIKATSLTYIE